MSEVMMTNNKQNTYLILFFSLVLLNPAWTQHEGHDHSEHIHHKHKGIEFIKNNNQLHQNVLFEAPINGANRLFLEQKTFTYLFLDEEDVHTIHDLKHQDSKGLKNHRIKGHSYRVKFKNALDAKVFGFSQKKYYYNYFRGNDSSRWAGNVPVFGEIHYENLYHNIDLAAYSAGGHFKYDFIIKKGGNPDEIQLEYEGMNRLSIKNGHLLIQTSVGTTRESKPYAYQVIHGQQKTIECRYKLKKNTVSFYFPNGYNSEYKIVIDPQVVAATLSGGSTSENWGHTATYDNQGNIYTGGIAFGTGYPVTLGAFQQNYMGGSNMLVDMVFSKYNSEGSSLIYATYLGGTGDDSPHSMIVDFNNQLCVLGTSDSQNFPTLPHSYQSNHGGNRDIVIIKLNATGSGLVGSTYIGGSQSDGQNESDLDVSYGEENRGEIVLDGQGNIYIASTSSSSNFPTTPNAFQGNKSGLQDGVVFKMNSDLTTLFWSTFLGSSGNDTAGGLKVDDLGNLVVVGTAGGSNFPMNLGGYQPTWPGGQENTYIATISANGQQMVNGTFWGTSNGNDHGYFVDIDEDKNIHILGTTTGTGLLHTPGTYTNNDDSPQYLAAFNSQLNDVLYSTTIGLGDYNGNTYDFVPIAFMVDKCNHIYFSGYYADAGLPTTFDAISTTGNSFYLGVLEPEATALSFGTYYGKSDHVDGGTSRFDKSGIVYQAVCSCDENVLNTTFDAWATNQIERCDIGVFKIDFEKETVTSAFTAVPSSSGCAPYTASFNYTGQDGEDFIWELDGNVIANSENTTYTFNNPGTYNVMLIASAGSTCNVMDTSFLQVYVLAGTSTLEILSFCPGEDFVFMDASTVNATYVWQDGFTGATYTTSDPGVYWVDISIPGCNQRDSFEVYVSSEIFLDLGPDRSICDIPNITLDVYDPIATEYKWSTGASTPSIVAASSGNYSVVLSDEYGCSISDNVNLTFSTTPVFSLMDSLICEGESIDLTTDIDADYLWSDGSTNPSLSVSQAGEHWLTLDNQGCFYSDTMELFLSYNPFVQEVSPIICVDECNGIIETSIISGEDFADLTWEWNIGGSDLTISNLCEGDYILTVTDENDCEFIHVVELVEPTEITYEIDVSSVVCFGDGNGYIDVLNIMGGVPPYQFAWNGEPPSENSGFDDLAGGDYNILISDANGCTHEENIFIYEPPYNFVDAGPDKTIELGDSVRIEAFVLVNHNQDISWAEAEGIWCTSCVQPIASPVNTTTYNITVINPLTGCVLTDEMTIFLEKPRNVFIPNAFSPNEDGYNDKITIYTDQGAKLIKSFNIYDRWGELVYSDGNFPPNSFGSGWDGIFNGQKMNPAVFVYTAEIEFLDGVVKFYKGDVTLLK